MGILSIIWVWMQSRGGHGLPQRIPKEWRKCERALFARAVDPDHDWRAGRRDFQRNARCRFGKAVNDVFGPA